MPHLLRLMIIVALAAIAFGQNEYPAIKIKIANSIPDYLVQYPNASVIKVIPVEEGSSYRQFNFGRNVDGDTPLATAGNILLFQNPQDVTFEVKYPSYNNMASISKLEIWVSQDSKTTSYSYITSIGPRNSSLSAWVHCKGTKRFQYIVDFFGHKINRTDEYPSTEIEIADKIEDYLTLHPSANVTKLSETNYNNGSIRYFFGNRFGADQLVSTANATYKFPIVQDVALSLEYPQINGSNVNITFVEFLLTKSIGGNAAAYIVSGGISRDFIKVLIHSKNTTLFNYDAKIYGF